MKDLLFIALILACPLAMAWMMRSGHGHGGASRQAGGHDRPDAREQPEPSIEELRRQRDELNDLIAQQEQVGHDPTPASGEQ